MPLRTDLSPFQEANAYLIDLQTKIETFEPEEQRKIKALCKLILGPQITLSTAESSTTEPMATMSRSFSNEDLTETKIIQTGIKSAVTILRQAMRNAPIEDKSALLIELKQVTSGIKEAELTKARTPYFNVTRSETDFASLKTAEEHLSGRLSACKEGIVNLTAEVAKCAVNVKNGAQIDLGRTLITKTYQETFQATQGFLTDLNGLKDELQKVSQDACTIIDSSLSKVKDKLEQLLKFSTALAIERANLDVQKKINRKLSLKERTMNMGYPSDQYPPVKGPKAPQDVLNPFKITYENMTSPFTHIQTTLSKADELLSHLERKMMGHLLADRHMINEELGEIRGLKDACQKAESKYPHAQDEIQALVNELASYLEPLSAFKQSLTASLSARTIELESKKRDITQAFNDLYGKGVKLKALLPECTVELKTL